MSTEPTTGMASIYIGLFLLQWIFNLALGAWVYFSKADNKNAKATEDLGRQLAAYVNQQNERMASLEASVRHLPTDDEITSLREDVATTKANVEGIESAVRRMEHQQNIIYRHLLDLRK